MMRQKTVKVNGVEYTLQTIPYRSYLNIVDNNTNERGILMKSNYADELFKHCVVSPKVKLEDFDSDYQSGYELISEVETFLGTRVESEEIKEESSE